MTVKRSRYLSVRLILALTLSAALAAPAGAGGLGSSVSIVVDKVTVESGNLYLFSSQFANPDACASAAVAVVPANTLHWEAFCSSAVTSLVTGKKLSFWFIGCVPAP